LVLETADFKLPLGPNKGGFQARDLHLLSADRCSLHNQGVAAALLVKCVILFWINTMISLNDLITINPEILSTELEGQVVMMHIDSGAYYNLDAIGSAIWQKLQSPIQIATLCQELKAEYRDPNNLIEQDVLRLLTQFAERNLIQFCAWHTKPDNVI
jgi:hypothetical protein